MAIQAIQDLAVRATAIEGREVMHRKFKFLQEENEVLKRKLEEFNRMSPGKNRDINAPRSQRVNSREEDDSFHSAEGRTPAAPRRPPKPDGLRSLPMRLEDTPAKEGKRMKKREDRVGGARGPR